MRTLGLGLLLLYLQLLLLSVVSGGIVVSLATMKTIAELLREIGIASLVCKVYELQLEGTDKYVYRLQDSSGFFFLDILHKITGFDDLSEIRKNSVQVNFGKNKIKVASLKDILHSKRTAARPKDLAVIPILEATKNEIEQQKKNAKAEAPDQENGMSM